jgi:hypothetical protein
MMGPPHANEEDSPQIAFGGSLDDDAARKYLGALDRLFLRLG